MSVGARCPAPTLTRQTPEIDIRPTGRAWPDLIRARWATHGLRAETRRFREQLGLPTDSPIIVTGHQPTMWHAGILAKYEAADIAAKRVDGHVVWLVADQDAVDPFELRLPVLDAGGALTTTTLRLGPKPPFGVAASMLPVSEVEPALNRTVAAESVGAGAMRIARAYREHRDAPNAAVQAGEATADLLNDLGLRGQLLFATQLASTDLFSSLVAQMRDEPDRFVQTYNAAVARRPHAGVSTLEFDEMNHRHELPLWRIRPGIARQRVFVNDLDSIPGGELAPRALLMTALLRLAGCELFIHGVGGAQYDQVTEDWIRVWLGVDLAPATLTTATLRLPLASEAPSQEDVKRAIWLTHHARHDPAAIGLEEQSLIKRGFVERIRSMRKTGANPAKLFHEMQVFLRDYRAEHAEQLMGLDAEAQEMARLAGEREIARDRTWAFALHDRESLDALRDAIDREFD